MDGNQKIQVRNFLRTNLETLKGDDLKAFVERYDVREAGHVEMMMLDMGGMSDDFVNYPRLKPWACRSSFKPPLTVV